MIRLQIQLEPKQAARLKERAAEEGVSVAALVRRAIDQAATKAGPSIGPAERWRRSLAAAGRFGSGKREAASEEHDRYLDEIYGQ